MAEQDELVAWNKAIPTGADCRKAFGVAVNKRVVQDERQVEAGGSGQIDCEVQLIARAMAQLSRIVPRTIFITYGDAQVFIEFHTPARSSAEVGEICRDSAFEGRTFHSFQFLQ